MDRITITQLKSLADTINKITGNPVAYSNIDASGHAQYYTCNVGNFHVEQAYLGFQLLQVMNECGGVRNITKGHVPARVLYDQMNMFIAGLEFKNKG